MKIMHTADWHIGDFKGPEKDGVNLRSQDTLGCLLKLVCTAREGKPDLILISGDIFHRAEVWQGRSHREVLQARNIIMSLSECAGKVVVMRGTPNHDSAEAFEELQAHFELVPNVDVVVSPKVIHFDGISIAVLPGFDRGVYRAKFPGLGKEEENEVFTKELANIVAGLRAECGQNDLKILMAHYTVPGSNTKSGQEMQLTQFEPIIPLDALNAADYDLVALGHIHRPQQVDNVRNCFYSGAINKFNFNDEGSERGFWVHRFVGDGVQKSFEYDRSDFIQTPFREFITYELTDTDITAINLGKIDEVAFNNWTYNGSLAGKIVRIHYTCSYENNKALNKVALERRLLEDGAFWVSEIMPDKVSEFADRKDLSSTTDPEENLRKYLENKYEFSEAELQELILKAQPIIQQAEANISLSSFTGTFEPVAIEVKNYRNYEDEHFDFQDISFCTINGKNGAGKSSLFMDAIIDCLFEEPREGDLTGWIRKDEKARSGSIMFTFNIGEKTYRVTRTRARSGKGTLNLSEFTNGEWKDRSCEKYKDTQDEIIKVLGMDSMTMKSCSMIMQDQYGLFLEAKKEDRMAILGNLLGLGIYDEMAKISSDRAREYGGKVRCTKQEINIKEQSVAQLGMPDSEIAEKEESVKSLSDQRSEKQSEQEKHKVTLRIYNEAVERRNRITQEISTLEQKKRNAEEIRTAQLNIVSECQQVLDQREQIEEKVSDLRRKQEKEKALAEKSVLYSSKQAEQKQVQAQLLTEEANLEKMQSQLLAEQKNKEKLEAPTDEEKIRSNAAEYEKLTVSVAELKERQLAHAKAEQDLLQAESELQAAENAFRQDKKMLDAEKSSLEKRAELLENSGCVDPGNASCRFLQDAVKAKDELAAIDQKYKTLMETHTPIIMERTAKAKEAQDAINSIVFNSSALEYQKHRLTELSDAPALLKELENKASRIALIEQKISSIEDSTRQTEERISIAKARIADLVSELGQYKEAHDERMAVLMEIEQLKPWLEKEKEIPVAEERKKNAANRFSEINAELESLQMELESKNRELSQSEIPNDGISDIESTVNRLSNEISVITKNIEALQMQIGAAKQRAEQISQLKLDIKALEEKKKGYAAEAAAYDTLKVCFNQDGIPHQIIRSVIPQITATANSILGQMTGGKMGLEFKTEKVMKSNSNKEVVALDIFIEEFGKSSLPYLSKSGGEKVKASLSAILSLAEIKSSSAGVQLGMLFIDEPPFLDADGIQAYCDALDAIRSRYENMKIMAITHDPTMKARFPQSIDIVKTDHGSKVVYL